MTPYELCLVSEKVRHYDILEKDRKIRERERGRHGEILKMISDVSVPRCPHSPRGKGTNAAFVNL